MRRSAAPSQRNAPLFLPPKPAKSGLDILSLLTNNTSSGESVTSSDPSNSIVSGDKNEVDNEEVSYISSAMDEESSLRDALRLPPAQLNKPLAETRPAIPSNNLRKTNYFKSSPSPLLSKPSLAGGGNPSPGGMKTSESRLSTVSSQHIETSSEFSYFSAVWCKKSNRKHKKWEGDAFLKVGTRSVVAIDENGKEIGRGSGYKATQLEDLEEGAQLPLGAKEVEISGRITEAEWRSRLQEFKNKENLEAQEAKITGKRKRKQEEEEVEEAPAPKSQILEQLQQAGTKSKFKPFKIPLRVGAENHFVNPRTVAPGVPMYDPSRADSLVLPRPPHDHPLHTPHLVDVVLDPYVARHLRPHQRAGVVFLYSSVMGYRTVRRGGENYRIRGAILADDMGLGKTLQSVATVWTLLKQSPVAGSVVAKRVLIVAPSSLLNNWAAEFRKWLGSERLMIHVADSVAKVSNFRSYNTAPVLLISYEMLVRAEAEVAQVNWDLIVCDEAHRLKNSEIKTSASLSRLACDRRVLLTGTPVQNDLQEYYCLVSAVSPGLLGSKAEFNAEFVVAIERGRQPSADSEDRAAADSCLNRLAAISDSVLLRRTSEIISQLLPPKTVSVVLCRPTDFQAAIYAAEVERLWNQLEVEPGSHLAAIANLKKICNSPLLLKDRQFSGSPNTWEEQSGKLAVVACMLLTLCKEGNSEKIVLVSLSTSTLDMLSGLCDRYSVPAVRLDGGVPTQARQQIVNNFNSPNSTARVFLLSSKAGGSGLNLTGASRIVLYDIDWNPATDLQAMARIWRHGQKRPCYIYRLLTVGTIEEKVYQRQLMKSGLAGGLESASLSSGGSNVHFTREELRDLFTFRTDTESDTHDLLACQCGGSGSLEEQAAADPSVEDATDRPCQLGRPRRSVRSKSSMEQLRAWRHYSYPIYDKVEDELLQAADSFVSFLFRFFEDSCSN